MNILLTIAVTFFAGMGAGLGTGFAGMSAAAVISPMLITFLKMDPYMAVGIALSSDVLASAVSAYIYGKNKNLDIKNGIIMMISVLTFTVVGSYIASLLPAATMGSFSVFMFYLISRIIMRIFSILAISSFDFPCFITSIMRLVSSGVKVIPFCLERAATAIRNGISSF